ncbi:hypothetical protein HanRHA438_Chr05g0213941 [Helianthus annuus]|nr:hypothetical protein HanIR_Chr05g0220511 [Helianthus annuus]KAJ0918120.1 hypothetical protein HanRHA438_Chr05g0213941 [Helianthus annuus]
MRLVSLVSEGGCRSPAGDYHQQPSSIQIIRLRNPHSTTTISTPSYSFFNNFEEAVMIDNIVIQLLQTETRSRDDL